MKTDAASRPAQRPGGTRVPFARRVLKLGLAFITAVLLLNLLTGSRGLPAVLQARREFQRDEHALDRLKAENAALRQEIKRLRMDPAAIEEAARRELGYIKPGEKLFVISDVVPPGATVPESTKPQPPGPPPEPKAPGR